MISFRKYLENEEYFSELLIIEKTLERIHAHNNHIIDVDMFICEAVIEPEKIKVNSYNEEVLNDDFKKYNIIFHNGYSLSGYYDKQKDEINIYYSEKDSFKEIEAMIGHEMVHKVQHKRSDKYFEQSKKIIDIINSNNLKLQELFSINTIESMKEWEKLRKQNIKIHNDFLYNSVFEKMAYAYQEVKLNTSGNIKDIIDKLERSGFVIDYKLKKYIGMYWLIKDKI